MAAVFAVMVFPRTDFGQSVEEAEASAGGGRESLNLTNIDLALELEGTYDRRRIGGSGGGRGRGTHRYRDWRLEESVDLHLGGSYLDESFLRWDGRFKFGLIQDQARERTDTYSRSEWDSGLLFEHALSLDLFSERPFSVHAYSQQGRSRVPRRFLPSLVEERRQAGIDLLYAGSEWTLEAGVEWDEVVRTGNRQDADDERRRHHRTHVDYRWQPEGGPELRIAYDHEREESDYQGSTIDLDTRRDQLRLEYTGAVDSAGRSVLDAVFRWNDEQGDLARDELEFSPRLTIRHSDAFQTYYRYGAYRMEQDDIEVTRHKIDLGGTYRANEHIRLLVDGYGLRERTSGDLEWHAMGGSTNAHLERPTRAGLFTVDVAFAADLERSVGSSEERIVRGEAHALDSVRSTTLRLLDVRPGTILVYDAGRGRIYLPGLDYVIQVVGRRTFLFRRLSGRITDGDVVYVDYRARIPTDARINTYRSDVNVEYALSGGWTPYYAMQVRRQETSRSRGFSEPADRTEQHRVGARYTRGPWSFRGEFERFDDSAEPFRAYRVSAGYRWLDEPDRHADSTVDIEHYDFLGGHSRGRVWWVELSTQADVRWSEFLSGFWTTTYRWEDRSRGGETNAIDVGCGLRYQRGYLGVDLSAEYDLLSIDGVRDEGVGVWLSVRRDLGHLFDSRASERRMAHR